MFRVIDGSGTTISRVEPRITSLVDLELEENKLVKEQNIEILAKTEVPRIEFSKTL